MSRYIRDRAFELRGAETSWRQISKVIKSEFHVKVHHTTISKWEKAGKKAGKKPKKAGRKPMDGDLRRREEQKVRRYLRASGGSATFPELMKEVQWDPAFPQSRAQLYRFLSSVEGTKVVRPRREYRLSVKDKKARVNFAKKYRNAKTVDWYYQDESKVMFCGGKTQTVLTLDTHPHPVRESDTHSTNAVFIWGCFHSSGDAHLEVLESALNKKKHSLLLHHYIPPESTVLQDGARPHVAAWVREIAEASNFEIVQTPARSPDLNPIERLWAELKRRVYLNNRTYSTKSALIASLKSNWEDIVADKQFLYNLANGLSTRIEAVIRSNGQWSK